MFVFHIHEQSFAEWFGHKTCLFAKLAVVSFVLFLFISAAGSPASRVHRYVKIHIFVVRAAPRGPSALWHALNSARHVRTEKRGGSFVGFDWSGRHAERCDWLRAESAAAYRGSGLEPRVKPSPARPGGFIIKSCSEMRREGGESR